MDTRHVNGNQDSGGVGAARAPALTTVALFGATAIVGQILLLRECLIVVAGNELFIALFFGCWFLGIAAGAGVSASWKPGRDRLTRFVPLFLLLQVALLPLLMIAVRAVRARWGLQAAQLMPLHVMLGMTLLHLCPFSFLTGLTFPMLCRHLAAVGGERGRSIGTVYATESFGSLVGGAVVTFVFTVWFKPLTAAWILAALTASNLVWFSLQKKGSRDRFAAWSAGALAVAAVIVLITPFRSEVERWGAGLRHRAYAADFEWLEERYTPYQHLALVRLGDQYSLLSNGRFVSSFPDPNATSATVHLLMSQSEGPRRVLLIGGEPTYVRSLLLYPDVEIDYVEIDPQVFDLVMPYLDAPHRRALKSPRVHIHHQDARRFVRRCAAEVGAGKREPYDVVLSITPEPSTAALNRFYTVEYFRQVRELLASSGVFVTTIGAGVNYFGRELLDYTGSVCLSLGWVFPHVLATPGTNACLFATQQDDLLTSDIERLIERFDRREIEDGDFSPLYFYDAYQTDQLDFVNSTLAPIIARGRLRSRSDRDFRRGYRERLRRSLASPSNYVPANMDTEPVTYFFNLRLWNRFSDSRSERLFAVVERFQWWWVAVAVLVFFALRFGTSRWLPMSSDHGAWRQAVVVLALTGAVGMVTSILLLLLYQNVHGSLYHEVGLLVACFMAGLTLGGTLGNRAGKSEKGILYRNVGMASLAFLVFLFALEAFVLFRWTGSLGDRLVHYAAFYYVSMVFAGALTGVPFSLAGRLAVACGRDPGPAGGVLEAADHLGACCGAFAAGIVLIPVSGFLGTFSVLILIELALSISVFRAAAKVLGQQSKTPES